MITLHHHQHPTTLSSTLAAHDYTLRTRIEGPRALRTGETLYVRALRADDSERLRALHASLSIESIIFRFFRLLPTLSPDLVDHFTHLDYANRMAIIATESAAPDAPILAVVRYDKLSADEAELAFVVQDHWQGRGIAPALLHRLVPYARAHGFTTLVAITMAGNARMLDVLRHAGYPFTMRYVDGDIECRLDIAAPQPAMEDTGD